MASEYFSDLNYTLANEDTRIELDLLPEGASDVFCIAGSGSRAFPLLAKNPKRLEIVDMSVSQLYLAELRIEAARKLSHEEWLFFLGYRGGLQKSDRYDGDDRLELFERLALSADCRRYWVERGDGWKKRGFILLGRWEGHFQKLGRIFRDGLRCDFSPIFEAQSLPEQIELWEKHWPKIRFQSFLKIAASEYVFNKFLYKGHFAGSDGHRTERRSPSDFLNEEFTRLFHTQLVRKNYFMQILFLGRLRYEEGYPVEGFQHIYEVARKAKTEIVYRQGNLLEILPERPWDFISLSDTVSYLPTNAANDLLQNLHKGTKKDSTIVIRSFMRGPTSLNSDGWLQMPDQEERAYKHDVTGVYRFHIFKKAP